MGLEIDGHFLPTALEGPCAGHGRRRAADDPMLREFRWGRWRACLLEVRWCRYYHARNCRDEFRRGARINQPAQPNRHIHCIAHQVPPHVLEQEMDVQIRILRCERGNTRNDRAESKARGRTYPQQSAQIPTPANTVFRLIEGPQDGLDASQKLAARLRRYDRASAA